MKLKNIKKGITRNLIAEHLFEGWTLDWDDASRGNKATFFLTKGDELRCMTAKEESGYGETLDKLVIRLFGIGEWWGGICGGFSWRGEDENDIATEVFWKVDEDWYVDGVEEAKAIFEKKRERIRRNFEPYKTEKPLKASEALIEAMKSVEGFDKATAKNVRVAKKTVRRAFGPASCGYQVTMLNRVGNVKAEKFYPLG